MDAGEKIVAVRRIIYDRGIKIPDKVKQIHELTAAEKKSKKPKSETREEPEATGYDREA